MPPRSKNKKQKRNVRAAAPSLYYEQRFKAKGFDSVIGVDEAGRGPLAGPVVAAAVMLKTTTFENRIDDSKKLSALQRGKAFPEITEKSIFGIGIVGERSIDRLNILVATQRAMEQAIVNLLAKVRCDKSRIHLLVDGNVALDMGIACTAIIKGDAKSKSIACASILAKVTRDRIMTLYDRMYPQYGFIQHKGYPTAMHREAIRAHGPSLIHRMSFLR